MAGDQISLHSAGGDLSMFPSETNAAAHAIGDAGRIIGDTWKAIGPALAADEALVGTGLDDLSATFRNDYNARKPQLEKLAADAEENFTKMGTNANEIVAKYVELQREQADRLRRV
ncbi:hypothetical protein ACWF0M_13835 [Kribbella sp. NPDC055110]